MSVSSKRTVAVWGAYWNGNFGDVLMGEMVCNHLVMQGYEVVAWRLPPHNNRWRSVSDVGEFLSGVRCVVLGGGAFFLDSEWSEWRDQLELLIDCAEKMDIPIIAISVGSDGVDLCHASQRLLESNCFKQATVRLPQDVALLESQGKDVQYFPDIVMAASTIQVRPRIKNITLCIGTNVVDWMLFSMMAAFLSLLKVKVVAVSQFLSDSPHYVSKPIPFIPWVQHSSTDELMSLLKKTDLIVSSGLHVGMAAFASGAQLISYRPREKTKRFLCDIGVEDGWIAGNKMTNGVHLCCKILKKVLWGNNSSASGFGKYQREAEKHFKMMTAWIGHVEDES